MLQNLQSLDTAALNAVRSIIDPASAWQVALVKAFTDLEVILAVLVLLGLWLYGAFFRKGKTAETEKRESLELFYVIAIAFAAYWVLNFGLPVRPRPETVSAIKPLVSHLPDNSFPSGHAIFAGASTVGAFVFLRRRWIAWTLLITGILMCLARVLAGIHYPGDILAGYFLGSILAYASTKLVAAKKFEKSAFFSLPIRIAGFFRL
jgi:membrane-associated phospholipid phosphatase